MYGIGYESERFDRGSDKGQAAQMLVSTFLFLLFSKVALNATQKRRILLKKMCFLMLFLHYFDVFVS